MIALMLVLACFTTYKLPNEDTASWYGPDFHGRLTSCGEVFDMNNPCTFAHKELPPGVVCRLTYAGVIEGEAIHNTRLAVTNDDGPYYRDRGIDLSYALACSLTNNHPEVGVIDVTWEIVAYKPRRTMRYNRYGTGEYEDLFRSQIEQFILESEVKEGHGRKWHKKFTEVGFIPDV